MNMNEFGAVLSFIIETYEKNSLDKLYSEIEQLIDQNRANPSDELSMQVREKIDYLLKLHKSIEPINWSYTQNKYFAQLGANKYFGLGAKTAIDKIMRDGLGDSGYVYRKIIEMHTGLKAFYDRAIQIKNSLGDLIKGSVFILEEGHAILQLVFDEKVNIDTVNELKEQSEEWNNILSWFTDAISDNHASPKILSISKESPVTIVIDGPASVVIAVGAAVQAILAVYQAWLNIEEQRLRIKKMKVEDPDKLLDKTFKSQRESILKKGIAKIKKELIKKYKKQGEGDKDTKLDMAVDLIQEFIFGGGRADIATEVEENEVPQDQSQERKGLWYKFQLVPAYTQAHQTEILVYKNQKLLEPPEEEIAAELPSQPESTTTQATAPTEGSEG